MEQGDRLRYTVGRLSRLIRQRRAVFYGLRGLVWGASLAVMPMLLRSVLEAAALPMVGGLVLGGALVGVVRGLLLPVRPLDAAQLADRAFALQDRLATALELMNTRAAGTLVTAVIRDAAEHAARLDPRRAVPWRWPREVRFLPAPVLALAMLPFLPPLPIPAGVLGAFTSKSETEPEVGSVGTPQMAERPARKRPEAPQRAEVHEREYARRQNPSTEQAKGDLAAIFKDTSVAQRRPDFSSFLSQGDERLRLLERVDTLPDLQRDFTESPYKVIFQRSRSLLGGMDPRQVSRERLRQLLDEMDRLGRRGSSEGQGADWGEDVWEGSEALERGQMSRALEAVERALDKLRAMEERQRAGKTLEGGRDPGGRGDGGLSEGDFEDEFGEGEGSLPGTGTNPLWRGDPTDRLAEDPLDFGIEGQLRPGRQEAYDTNVVGRGARNASRLPHTSVLSQYRKMMEDALVKESIPFNYRTQVKEYFQSLETR